jgi:hypothetical protein
MDIQQRYLSLRSGRGLANGVCRIPMQDRNPEWNRAESSRAWPLVVREEAVLHVHHSLIQAHIFWVSPVSFFSHC